jgi:branched-subunit amino acid permease
MTRTLLTCRVLVTLLVAKLRLRELVRLSAPVLSLYVCAFIVCFLLARPIYQFLVWPLPKYWPFGRPFFMIP